MFIHFAFSQLGKKGKIAEQTEKIITTILTEKRLTASNCTEFLPAFPLPGGMPIPLKLPATITKDDKGHPIVRFNIGENVKDRQPNRSKIKFLPCDIAMICFINISFDNLKTSPHSKEYGKFGIVLNTEFLKSAGIRPVSYYSEESLWHDPEIIAWNNAFRRNKKNRKALQDEIVAYRKPETYFRGFADLTTITIRYTSDNTTTSRYKYDRYPVGYDFREEHEYRIVFQSENEDLQFKEDEVHMIIVPTLDTKNEVISYLKSKWKRLPLEQLIDKAEKLLK